MWSAFVKYLKNMNAKERSVDTQVCGVFIAGADRFKFYPSPDFMEAGKFKMGRDLRKELSDSQSNNYRELYESLGEAQLLPYQSIASVCDISAEQAKQLVVDIFSGLIEVNTKTKR